MRKTILITGSNSGFGRLTAEALAKDGHIVFASMRQIHGKNAEAAKELKAWAQQEQAALFVIDLDVTSDTSVTQAVQQIIQRTGRLDVAVNNAGVSYSGVTEGFSVEQIQAIFDINVFGALRVNKAVLPYMRQQSSGLLIHISSTFGRFSMPYSGLYSASKFAMEGFAEAYRYELESFGIDSVIIEPGPFPTEHGSKIVHPVDKHVVEEYGVAAKGGENIGHAIGNFFEKTGAPNPQMVADAVRILIATPHGQRPMRTIVDSLTEQIMEEINAIAARGQKKFLTAYGIREHNTPSKEKTIE